MPYLVKGPIHHDGVAYDVPMVVSDELGNAMNAEHPHNMVRVAYDPDLCANMIGGPAPAPAPAPAPVLARKPEASE